MAEHQRMAGAIAHHWTLGAFGQASEEAIALWTP